MKATDRSIASMKPAKSFSDNQVSFNFYEFFAIEIISLITYHWCFFCMVRFTRFIDKLMILLNFYIFLYLYISL